MRGVNQAEPWDKGMLPLAIAAALVLLPPMGTSQTAVRQNPLEAHTKGAAVTGSVVDDSGAPLSGVRVVLGSQSSYSDARGQFLINDVAPGPVPVIASLDAFTLAHDSPRVASVGSEGTNTLTLRMVRSGAIDGIVEDEDGQPVAKAVVSLFQERFQVGEHLYIEIPGAAQSDVIGRFRLGQIPPGKYYVGVSWPLSGAGGSTTASIFYPDSTTLEGAAPVRVYAGSQLSGLRLRTRSFKAYSVRGRVVGLMRGAKASIRLQSAAGAQTAVPVLPVLAGSRLRTTVLPDGAFALGKVAPGSYIPSIVEGGIVWTMNDILQVKDRDVPDLRLDLPSTGTVAGKLIFEGATDLGGIRQFELVGQGYWGSLAARVDVKLDNTFSQGGLPAGHYRIVGLSSRFSVSKVVNEAEEWHGGAFSSAKADNGQLSVAVSTAGPSISGSVESRPGFSGPVRGIVTAVISPLSRPSDGATLRTAEISPLGDFVLPNLEPSTYRVCAWFEIGSRPVEVAISPRFQRSLESVCTLVKLRAKESQAIRVKQITAADFP